MKEIKTKKGQRDETEVGKHRKHFKYVYNFLKGIRETILWMKQEYDGIQKTEKDQSTGILENEAGNIFQKGKQKQWGRQQEVKKFFF